MEDVDKTETHKVSRLAVMFATVAGVGAAVVFAYAVWIVATVFGSWQDVLKEHFAAIIGLPGAAAAAFVLVVFLRQTDGPIEFQGLGFRFSGASGQVAMWVVCFLAIAAAIKLCW